MIFPKAADERCHAIVQELGPGAAVVVEIGVYVGRLSRRLLEAHPGIFLHMVDPWAPTGSAAYIETNDERALSDEREHMLALGTALTAVRPYQGRYTIQRMTSEQASSLYADGSLDLVFIDGDHSYEGCSTDIRLWWPKVKIGGILGGHDYRTDKNFGVIRAVHEFIGNSGFRLGLNHTWFITKDDK